MKFFFRTLPRLLSCLALAVACTPAPALTLPNGDEVLQHEDGATTTIFSKGIAGAAEMGVNTVVVAHSKRTASAVLAGITATFAVHGCLKGQKVIQILVLNDQKMQNQPYLAWSPETGNNYSEFAMTVCLTWLRAYRDELKALKKGKNV